MPTREVDRESVRALSDGEVLSIIAHRDRLLEALRPVFIAINNAELDDQYHEVTISDYDVWNLQAAYANRKLEHPR